MSRPARVAHRRVVAAAPAPATEEARALLHHPHARTHIRSFVLKGGRVSDAQRAACEALYPRWGIAYRPRRMDLHAAFERTARLVLEIGFGMGETTACIAAEHPELDFVAIEVYTAGVGTLLRRIEAEGLANLRVIQHDAVEVVRDMVAPASLHGVHVFFPDPWHKARHHKRRLIQPPFVHLLATRIAPGGYLHCATDWEDYAEQMLEVLAAEPLLENTVRPKQGFAPRPDYRPMTKFEQRGIRLGHGVRDLVFRRRREG
ncbi:MAG: tRNA (guanosine(46)-N7)-methyltransferase TrmB [Burkholderiales bacterium]|nr:MAG: tRNA (guanosine(46)-N7)-methyltransferase TrmB [Burkholderiales bacterium]